METFGTLDDDARHLYEFTLTLLRNEKKESNIQVVLYNQALTPEMRRITDKAQGRWGEERKLLQLVNPIQPSVFCSKFAPTL